MKNILPIFRYAIIAVMLVCFGILEVTAQTYPSPGFNLPAGKTIVITYEVDVNANVCPNGTLGTDISNQSNVSGSNFTTVQTDEPSNPAANPSPTLTPISTLTLGNLVYKDVNQNGVFDGGDTGIDGVTLKLYTDANSNGFLDAGDGASIATATTAGGGLYAFTGLCPGFYLVEAVPSNFLPGGALYDNGLSAALVSSPVGGALDPDNNINNDDNGDPINGFGVATLAITLELGTEPINDGDADNNTNLTLDLGFKTPTTVSINDVSLAEGTGGATTAFNFTVTRTDNAEAFSLTVNTANGTAIAPSDYTTISGGTVNFTAGGALTQTVTVLVNQDNAVEANETFTVLLSGAPGGIIITDGSGLGTINNDDAAVVTLSGGISQNEGTSFIFTATLNNPVQGGFSVVYTTNNGTATTTDNDYTDNDGSFAFAGIPGESKTITVLSTVDNKVELDETFTVALGAITGAPAGVSTAGSPQTGTITNDDAALVSIAANVSQSESTTPQAFSVTLSNPVDVAVTVQFSTSDGTATTADNDYTAIASQTVTFATGTITAQTVNVTIVNDTKVEADEVYNASIGTLNATGRNVSLGTSTRTGTITNDDAAVVTLSGGGSANEGNSGTTSRVFTATLNNPVQGGFTLAYSTNDGTATVVDNDYVDNDGPALVFAGTAAEAKTITVLVNGDTKVEANETFTVALGAITGAPAGVTTAGSPQTGSITNDEIDWGDGPDSLPTLLVYNGARHNTVLGFQLGAAIDGDPDGQGTSGSFNNLANGDDTDADGDDEDGVTLPSVFVRGTTATITVNASQAGKLDAWMDFDWSRSLNNAGEKIFNNLALAAGDNVLTFAVPSNAVVGSSFLRFRFSSAGGLLSSGLASDGEVEDYRTNIVDNQFSINSPSVVEGNAGTSNLTFTISRTTNTTASSVNYAITGGTATAGTDYATLAAGTVNFTAGGALTQTITVTVNGDVVVENDETVIITLSNPVNGGIGTNPGTGTITNDDAAVVTLTGGSAQNEGNAGTVTYTFTATLNNAVQGGFTVPYTTGGGTAIAGSDYTDNDGTLTFAGTAGEIKTWSVTVNGDVTVELDETFQGALGALSGAPPGVTTAGSPQTATITNDDAATISIAANVSGPESTTPQTFSVTLSNPVDVPVTVQFNTADGTATTADVDYTGIVNQTVTFAANTTTAQSVNVVITNDPKVEANETYTGTISSLSASGRNVTLGTATRTGTITNDDATNLFIAGPVSLNEGNTGTTNYLFSISLTAPVQGGFTANYTTNDGTATLANLDYVDNDGSLTYTGVFNETKTVTVQVVGDLNIENNEIFTLLLGTITASSPEQTAAISITGNNPETGTIVNDELDWGDAPTAAQSGFAGTYPTLAANNGARHAEAPGGLRLGATVDADLDGQPNALANGDGADEDGVTLPGALIINTTANITVNASGSGFLNAWVDFNRDGDWNDAGEQVFTNTTVVSGNNALSFAVPGTASLGGTFVRFRVSTASGTGVSGLAADGEVEDYAISILDNQFSINDPSVAEGNAGTSNLVFTVSRTTNATASSVNYAITGGTATSGTDYAALAAGTVNFTAGGALTQTVTVTVNGDLVVEDNETVIITLSTPVNGGIADNTGIGTITNDDAANLTLSGSIAQNEGNAGTTTYTFTATLSAAVQGGFTVAYSTNNGTATTADNDYTDNDGSLSFAGNLGETKTITVLVNGDVKVELDETFTVALGTITGTSATQLAAISPVGSPQTGTITNDDAATVSIAANISQAEAVTPQAFSVTLSNPVDVPVTVQFSTSNGTATTADNDYNVVVSQTVTFPAGSTATQTVNVTINDDNKVEADEVFNTSIGTLSAGGRNVSLGVSARTGTILNDDNATVTLSGGISQNEGNLANTTMVFTATLNNPVQGGLTANYTTNDGTATVANNDYQDNDGSLIFAGNSGETKTFTVTIVADNVVEANETFTTTLNSLTLPLGVNAANVTVVGSPQTGTILNDEVDFGDAPDTYGTLLASNGARHNTVLGFRLGAGIDGEVDGLPNANADGDGADDDGVTLPNPLITNTTANIVVNASAVGKLDAWVDFNNNGNFNDPGEKVFNNTALVAGNNNLSFAVPNGATPAFTYARFRLSTAGGLMPTGLASDGEVEDYRVQIVNTQFTINDPIVTEGNAGTTNLAFVITRSNNASACSVNYAITGGTATSGSDYQTLAAGTASFTAGGALTQTINVVVNGDVTVELDETVVMTLTTPVNGTILDDTGIGTITNDDAAVLSVSSPAVAEGGPINTVTLTFNLTLSNPSDANVVVNYATLDGTATIANNDYQSASGNHTFTPGQTSKQVVVTIVGDCVIEPNETLILRLSNLVNNGRNITLSGGGATTDGTGTINNDDFAPTFTVTGGGTRCTTDNVGLPVGLSGSQTGVNYQLLLNGNNVGAPVAGTGNAISFGDQLAVGTYTVVATITATGCTQTMLGSVSIATFNCTTTISDPCVCLNNATTLTNGQFGEQIKVNAPSTQIWTVSAINGLYSAFSPAPPAAPVAIPVGTVLTNIGGNMFTLDGRHIDALGYTISVTNGRGTTLSIGNSCQYPNPAITSNLDGPFCLYSDIVPLTGTPGDANIVSAVFTVNGVPATQFDPGAGVGQYVIEYTVNGGTPKAFGANDPGCIQKVSNTVNVIATPSQLACNDLVYLSLDVDCISEINPDDILEGSYGCYDDYIVELDETLPYGNGPWVPGVVGAGDVGKTYQVRVTHLVTGNKCWGNIKIEDKLEPEITCSNITLFCPITNYEPNYLKNTLGIAAAFPTVTDCSNYTLTYIDTYKDLACGQGFNGVNDLSAYVIRKWTAKDAWGNESICTQYIYFKRLHVQDVLFPADFTISCNSNNINTNPSVAGVPYVKAFGLNWGLFPDPAFCEMQAAYVDQILPVCDGTYKILRTWTVIDWCLPTTPFPPSANPQYYIQLIKVVDDKGPALACPVDITVTTDPYTCCATSNLPDVILKDNCSRINNIGGMVTTFDPYTGQQLAMYTIGGSLTSFPGNNLWDLDTLGNWGNTPCLPIGTHRVVYTAEDDCGNTSTCSFRLTVADYVPPVAACDQYTVASVIGDDPFDCYEPADGCDGAGITWIKATTFDDGSYDNCNNLKFTVRRMAPYSDCINNLQDCEKPRATEEQDSIKFYCCEVGTTQTVILRVYQVDLNGQIMNGPDGTPLYNECMVNVEVQDKIKPVCVPPANVTVSCENFDPSLWAYGKASVYDNCCLDKSKVYQEQCGLTHTVNLSLFDTVCNKGTITRTFRAFDCHGLSSQCTQRVVVNYEQDYFVKFPNDVIVSVCDGTGNYGAPSFFGEDCELLGVSFEDEIFTVVPDACFKIERTWTVINWCTYNPNLGCINVPNPNPNAITNHPSNLPGVTVSPLGTATPWNPTVVKINPTDATTTNYSIFYDPNANCYKYKQIIKVIDTQDPTVTAPTSPVEYCDVTPNDPQLWNNSYWWDNTIASHDLCEGDADLSITGTDACSGSNISFRYLLFLDLDGDGVMETVVSSTNLPGVNNVQFGNATNANYTGGQPRAFDGRPVPFNQQYRFGLDWTTSGTSATAKVRFDNLQSPIALPGTGNNVMQGVVPQLPYGTHKIKWFVEDGCGNETISEYTFVVKDCKKPTVVCLNGLSVNIMPTQMIQLWASDFLQYTQDNCTPADQLKIAIRKSNDPTPGFPVDAQGNPITSVTFTCGELGTQLVKLWSIDKAGNADYCETYVIVQDNNANCPPSSGAAKVAGALATEAVNGVQDGNVEIAGSGNGIPSFTFTTMSNASGVYNFNAIPLATNSTVTPAKDDNPLNGVSTYDLVLISKHILGIESLNSPYKMIAADANKSGSITTFDIVELRKLILGIYSELPNNTSWRFVDKSYVFPNLNNPFATQFPENKSIVNLSTNMLNEDFVSVKVGDVNGNAIANAAMSSDDRSSGTLLFDVDNKSVTAGETFTVNFNAAEKVSGYQFTMNFKGLEVVDVVPVSRDMKSLNFGVFANSITTSYDGEEEGAFSVTFRALQGGKLSEMLYMSSCITKAEAYKNGERMNVAFRFNNGTTTSTIAGVGFELYQNQPNPFVNKTMIGFHLPEATTATLSIYDETGRVIYNQKAAYAKGYNAVTIDRALLNTVGVLYYKLETATDSATKKMIQTK